MRMILPPELLSNAPQISAAAEFQKSYTQLHQHVQTLSHSIGERNLWQFEALLQTMHYLEQEFKASHYVIRQQAFEAGGRSVRNFEVECPGTHMPQAILIIGAHYDTQAGTPGADANASGIAVLLELARLLKVYPPKMTVRLVAFCNEENPFFMTGQMGSYKYALHAKLMKENIIGMIALETLGFYSRDNRSQKFPFQWLNWLYPSTGNFLAFIGNLASRELLKRCVKLFKQQAHFPVESMTAPMWFDGISGSDHAPFWAQGYPAFMLTDTGAYRNPHYHSERDTIEQLDFQALTEITLGLRQMITALGPLEHQRVEAREACGGRWPHHWPNMN